MSFTRGVKAACSGTIRDLHWGWSVALLLPLGATESKCEIGRDPAELREPLFSRPPSWVQG